jgi:hypothetical protein
MDLGQSIEGSGLIPLGWAEIRYPVRNPAGLVEVSDQGVGALVDGLHGQGGGSVVGGE